MMESVQELVNTGMQCIDNSVDREDGEEFMEEYSDYAIDIFYTQVMPMRSFPGTRENEKLTYVDPRAYVRDTWAKLQHLKDVPQPEQRTPEWYMFRHNLITASSAHKIFDTQSTINQLIYEKCKPIEPVMPTKLPEERKGDLVSNINSPTHWGQKYENVSVMYYEDTYETKVDEFGCIVHKDYPFLGASPDGIVCSKASNRFGRMLEIKNVVSRVIDGIPIKSYWIQMQLQMEVCDLEECDFLETKFVEYASEEEFEQDGTFCQSNDEDKLKGIMVCFADEYGLPVYEYKPLKMEKDVYTSTWLPAVIQNHEKLEHTLKTFIYWKLDVVSCVLVKRNRIWFDDVIGKIKDCWDTIERERVSGYDHRAPKKARSEATRFVIEWCMCITMERAFIQRRRRVCKCVECSLFDTSLSS